MPGKKKDSISAGNNSDEIGRRLQGNNIVIGNNNSVTNASINLAPLFDDIYKKLDIQKDIPSDKKDDIKAELQEIKTAFEKPEPDESFLARRFRNIKRMAPDIVEVAFETLKNPIGGVVEVVKRVSAKMAEEANAK